MAVLTLGTASCSHKHVFDNKIDNPEHVAEEGDCNILTKYYYSCECGKNGEETFTLENGYNHAYGEYTSNLDASCYEEGTKSAICEKCGNKNTIKNEGSLQNHAFELHRGQYRDGELSVYYYQYCKWCLNVAWYSTPIKKVSEVDKNDGQNYEYLYEFSEEKQDYVLFSKSSIIESTSNYKEKYNYSLVNDEWVIDSKSIITKENGKAIKEEIYRQNGYGSAWYLDTEIEFQDNPTNFFNREKTIVFEYLNNGLKTTGYNICEKIFECYYTPSNGSYHLTEEVDYYYEENRIKSAETFKYEDGKFFPTKKIIMIPGISNEFWITSLTYSDELKRYLVDVEADWEYSFCFETRTEILILTQKINGKISNHTKTINYYDENYQKIKEENYIFDEASNTWVISEN